MRIHLLALGERRARWEREGYETYAARLPRECALRLVELPTARRTKGTPVERTLEREGEKMLAAIPERAVVVALDERGTPWSTAALADRLREWQRDGRDVALLIGGPDGLAPRCLERAQLRWSLSAMTLPHGLARIVVAEQIYRAWSMLTNHPYHRA